MQLSPYDEESLRVLHDSVRIRFKTLLEESTSQHLSSAIAKLDSAAQVLLALIYLENLDVAEIAGLLKISVWNVVRLHALAFLALNKFIGHQ